MRGIQRIDADQLEDLRQAGGGAEADNLLPSTHLSFQSLAARKAGTGQVSVPKKPNI